MVQKRRKNIFAVNGFTTASCREVMHRKKNERNASDYNDNNDGTMMVRI